MPFRLRKSVAIVCIAIAVFAAFNPAVAFIAPMAILPVWMYVPIAPALLAENDCPSAEQTASLLRLLSSRAPPFFFRVA